MTKYLYHEFVPKYDNFQAMPEVVWLGNCYVRPDTTWCIKGLANSGGLSESESKMVETLISKLNSQGKAEIGKRLYKQRHCRNGLDRLVKYFRVEDKLILGKMVKAPPDRLKLAVVGGEIVWKKGSILEGMKLEEASSMPML